jgi:hypothetical protein
MPRPSGIIAEYHARTCRSLANFTFAKRSKSRTNSHALRCTLGVRFGSKCDIAVCRCNVGFAPMSGHANGSVECRKWASSGLMRCGKTTPLFDHLVGNSQQRRQHPLSVAAAAWLGPPGATGDLHGCPFQTARNEPPPLASLGFGFLMGHPKRHGAVATLVPAFRFSFAVPHLFLRNIRHKLAY